MFQFDTSPELLLFTRFVTLGAVASGLGQSAFAQPAFGQTAESAWQQAFAESHTCSVCAAQQESAPAALASAAFFVTT